MWLYSMPLNYSLKNGKFSLMCILQQLKIPILPHPPERDSDDVERFCTFALSSKFLFHVSYSHIFNKDKIFPCGFQVVSKIFHSDL